MTTPRRLGVLTLLAVTVALAGCSGTSSRTVPPPQGEDKPIALTFDDGPSADYTAPLLAVLTAYHLHCTFFVVGQAVQSHPEVLREEVAAGQEIGIHTWAHTRLIPLSQAQVTADSERCLQLLRAVAGAALPVAWERPPYGGTDAVVKAGIAAAGLQQVLWDVQCGDWGAPSASTICQRVLDRVYPGAVVLMHDGGGDRSQTVKGVGLLVPKLLALGYQPVTISKLKAAPTP